MAYTLEDYKRAEAEVNEAKARFIEIRDYLTSEMRGRGIKTQIEEADGVTYRVTLVESETLTVDEDTLLKTIGKRAFARVANLKLDKKKLEAAVHDGSISPELVAGLSVISRGSPYLRVSPYTGED